MRNPQTGILKTGYVGFSWTTLFFGGFPAIFRGDIILGVILLLLYFPTWGIAPLIWAFVYNKNYTIKLLEKGYKFADDERRVAAARAKLGITAPDPTPQTMVLQPSN